VAHFNVATLWQGEVSGGISSDLVVGTGWEHPGRIIKAQRKKTLSAAVLFVIAGYH
jgi:hypothetical protein